MTHLTQIRVGHLSRKSGFGLVQAQCNWILKSVLERTCSHSIIVCSLPASPCMHRRLRVGSYDFFAVPAALCITGHAGSITCMPLHSLHLQVAFPNKQEMKIWSALHLGLYIKADAALADQFCIYSI